MNLNDYFENTQGTGILATADSEGNVDVAVYARPHVMDENTVAFIMADRLSYHNLASNPKAAYLFLESGPGYKGRRLYLSKIKEENDQQKINSLRRRTSPPYPVEDSTRHLVHFQVDQVRPITGD